MGLFQKNESNKRTIGGHQDTVVDFVAVGLFQIVSCSVSPATSTIVIQPQCYVLFYYSVISTPRGV